MPNHKKIRERHDRLCFTVAKHMRKYDVVMVNQPFAMYGHTAGDHDSLGLVFDEDQQRVISATSYEVKGKHTYKGHNKARKQSYKKFEAMKDLYPYARINVNYVSQTSKGLVVERLHSAWPRKDL